MTSKLIYVILLFLALTIYSHADQSNGVALILPNNINGYKATNGLKSNGVKIADPLYEEIFDGPTMTKWIGPCNLTRSIKVGDKLEWEISIYDTGSTLYVFSYIGYVSLIQVNYNYYMCVYYTCNWSNVNVD